MSKEVVQLFAKEEFSLAYMANIDCDGRELNMWLDEIQDTLEGTGFMFIPKNGSVWGPNNGMKPDEFRDLFWDAHVRVVDCELAVNGVLPANVQDVYPRDWSTRIVPETIKRANHRCEHCGAEDGVGEFYGAPLKLTVLHRNHNIRDNRPENWVALCQSCRLKYERQKKEVSNE